ncbi:MAG: hypothetical protein MI725_17595, partial [Pirellulales bacterium]|nr:hypothetical protein [Pirellulales bacterium]
MTLPAEHSQFSDKQKQEFCLMISIGCDRETACKYLSWRPDQLRRALEQDPEFAKQLLKAEATPEFSHMRNLHNAAKDEKNWRVSVWWLERNAPERYARRAPDALSATQLQQVIEELAEAIVSEVASECDRERLLARFEQIARAIQTDSF